MTKLARIRVTCASCRQESEQTVVMRTLTTGYQDLDCRPPECLRSTLSYQIMRCARCGYCAPNIGEKMPCSRKFLLTEAYRRQLEDPRFPDLANSYLCYALLAQEGWEYRKAAQAAMDAAWCCDDLVLPRAAVQCRRIAVQTIRQAREKSQEVATQFGVGELIESDLLRRSGEYEEAALAALKGLKLPVDGKMREVLEFELFLIDHKDCECHNLEEALESGKSPWRNFLTRLMVRLK